MKLIWSSVVVPAIFSLLTFPSCNGFVLHTNFAVNRRKGNCRPYSAVNIPRSLFHQHKTENGNGNENRLWLTVSPKKQELLQRIRNRFDTIHSAGLEESTTHVSGIFRRIKDIHNPITYLILSLVAGFRLSWCFRSPYYWFAVAFCIKWYRARYVFKIPVWDRQPNWNNVITSKEQEKDLKAFTCKNCGSTLFIAKTREFFFEGNTGIGGLGCFSCGAKGKDNFIMDRDRIVEDVADVDDYFDYERPLDFVSRAERRQVMKEAKGDEERANQILIERSNAEAATSSQEDVIIDVNGEDGSKMSAEEEEEENQVATEELGDSPSGELEEDKTIESEEAKVSVEEETTATVEDEDEPKGEVASDPIKIEETKDEDSSAPASESGAKATTSKNKVDVSLKQTTESKSSENNKLKSASSSSPPPPPPPPKPVDDDLDLLDMDNF